MTSPVVEVIANTALRRGNVAPEPGAIESHCGRLSII